jgi:hypothetical protein
MIVDCNKMWTQLVNAVYRLRRLPTVTNIPPPVDRPVARPAPVGPERSASATAADRRTRRRA